MLGLVLCGCLGVPRIYCHRWAAWGSFDFPTLCASVPNGLLGSHMNNIMGSAFGRRSGAARCARIGVGGGGGYFASDP